MASLSSMAQLPPLPSPHIQGELGRVSKEGWGRLHSLRPPVKLETPFSGASFSLHRNENSPVSFPLRVQSPANRILGRVCAGGGQCAKGTWNLESDGGEGWQGGLYSRNPPWSASRCSPTGCQAPTGLGMIRQWELGL